MTWETGTVLIVGAIVLIVAAIVVVSIVVGARRRRLARELDDSRVLDGEAVDDSAIGDRSEIMHRARRGF